MGWMIDLYYLYQALFEIVHVFLIIELVGVLLDYAFED
jgi:hypothetical protein